MGPLDPAGEWLRISEHYRQLSDSELLVLGRQRSELTDFAQQALALELSHRGLQAEEDETAKPTTPSQFRPRPAFFEHESPKLRDSAGYDFPNPDSTYDEDRKLVELCIVWSVRDALKVQTILDRLGIPFFMGPEKATGVAEVTSNFADGIAVQIMQIGLPWAGPAMRNYEPEDDPNPKENEVLDELPVRCPKCHSPEVIFEGGTASAIVATDDSSQKYQWTCDACGHQWQDDGIVREV
ncbi:MAG TPA: hypothetical protein VNW47_13150 [Terriglobales bacterium]|jgi:hypothetical protein|nr:hypothetical protein [Terriglobales bacterium]